MIVTVYDQLENRGEWNYVQLKQATLQILEEQDQVINFLTLLSINYVTQIMDRVLT